MPSLKRIGLALVSAAFAPLALASPAAQITNPANLVVAGKGMRWEAGLIAAQVDSSFDRAATTGVAPAGHYEAKRDHPLLPIVAFSHSYNDRVTLGLAIDVAHYLDITWKDHTFDVNFAGTPLDLTKQGKLVATRIGPAAAMRLGDNWSVGGRLFVQHVEAAEDTDFGKVAGTGNTYGVHVGARYTTKGYIIGSSFATRTRTDVRGSQTNVPAPLTSVLIPGDAKADILLPARWQNNVAFALRPTLWAEIELEWLGWSYVDELTIYQSDGSIINRGKNLRHYHDTVNSRLGVRWQKAPKLAIYGGIGYEPTPVPEQDATPARPFLRRSRAAVGATWGIGNWQLDTAYHYARGHPRTINQTDQDTLSGADSHVYEGTYSSKAHAVKITFSGAF